MHRLAYPLLAVCFFAGCHTPPPVNHVRLKDDVHVLDGAAMATLRSFDKTTGVIEIDPSVKIVVGELVVGGIAPNAKYGLLRRVTAVNGSHVETTFASLVDVVAEGRIEIDQPFGGEGIETVTPNIEGVAPRTMANTTFATPGGLSLGFDDVLLKDVDGDTKTKDDQIRVSGSVSMDPRFKLVFDVGLLEDGDLIAVKEVSAAFVSRTTISSRMVAGVGTGAVEDVKLATVRWLPIEIPVGFPLVIFPQVNLMLAAEASVTAKFVGEASATAQATAGWGGSRARASSRSRSSRSRRPPRHRRSPAR